MVKRDQKLLDESRQAIEVQDFLLAKAKLDTVVTDYAGTENGFIAATMYAPLYNLADWDKTEVIDIMDNLEQNPVWDKKLVLELQFNANLASQRFDKAEQNITALKTVDTSEVGKILTEIDELTLAVAVEQATGDKGMSQNDKIHDIRAEMSDKLKELVNLNTSTVAEGNNQDMNIPDTAMQNQNYPNPFNPATTIKYALPEAADVKIKIFNAKGAEVATQVNGSKKAGYHSVQFNGSKCTSGLYFYSLEANGRKIGMKKMMLIK